MAGSSAIEAHCAIAAVPRGHRPEIPGLTLTASPTSTVSPSGRRPSPSVSASYPAGSAEELGRQGIFVWDGNYYALAVMERLGLEDSGGACGRLLPLQLGGRGRPSAGRPLQARSVADPREGVSTRPRDLSPVRGLQPPGGPVLLPVRLGAGSSVPHLRVPASRGGPVLPDVWDPRRGDGRPSGSGGRGRRRRAGRGAPHRDDPVRRPGRVHRTVGPGRPRGRAPHASGLPRPRQAGDRAVRRDRGQVHRRRGHGRVRGAGGPRRRPRTGGSAGFGSSNGSRRSMPTTRPSPSRSGWR